jgi:hypothetical protein
MDLRRPVDTGTKLSRKICPRHHQNDSVFGAETGSKDFQTTISRMHWHLLNSVMGLGDMNPSSG